MTRKTQRCLPRCADIWIVISAVVYLRQIHRLSNSPKSKKSICQIWITVILPITPTTNISMMPIHKCFRFGNSIAQASKTCMIIRRRQSGMWVSSRLDLHLAMRMSIISLEMKNCMHCHKRSSNLCCPSRKIRFKKTCKVLPCSATYLFARCLISSPC